MLKSIRSAWVFLPCTPYFLVSSQTSVNIPIMDDYEMVLQTLIDWKHADLWGKVAVIFAQYNEHRIVFPRLVYVLYYEVFGNVDFRNLIFIANAQLLAVACMGVYFIRKLKANWSLYSFIWVLFVFDLNSYENGSIASYGMQNWSVLMWVMLAFYFYSLPGKWWMGGCIAQFIAVFCSGNGMVAGPLLILAYPIHRTASVITFILSIFLFFLCNYEFVHQPNQYFNMLVIGEYFVRVIGAPVSFDWSLPAGVVIIGFLIYATNYLHKDIWKNKNWWPLLALFAFIVTTIGEAALFRSGLPNAQFQTSRYLIYPQLLLAITFLFMPLQKKYNQVAAIALCLLIYYHNFTFGKAGFERMEARAEHFKYYHPNPQKAEIITKEADKEGIYP